MKTVWSCVFALGAVLTILSGCGGGSTPPPPATPPTITTTTVPGGTVNTAYSATLTATGGTAPLSWSVSSGTLPAGITLSTSGALSGTPTAAGKSNFTVQVTDSANLAATQPLTLEVTSGSLTFSNAAPPAGVVNTSYTFTFTASGGIPPYKFSQSGSTNSLPPGLTLTSAGVVSGIPTASGSFAGPYEVEDSADNTFQTGFTFTINTSAVQLPQGGYAFGFGGKTAATGTPADDGVALNGAYLMNTAQAIALGFYDENTTAAAPQASQTLNSGSVAIGANRLGTVALKLADSSTVTFAVAAPSGIGNTNDTSTIRIIEFDDTTGTGKRGAGVIKFQPTNTTVTTLMGGYVFSLSGLDASGNRVSLAGQFVADGSGGVTTVVADKNDNGVVTHLTGSAGTYTLDALGRATVKLPLNGTTFTYALYPVSQTEFTAITGDQTSSTVPLLSGTVLAQSGTFSNASLQGVDVLELVGAAAGTADLTLGLATVDGAGTITLKIDENNNGLQAPQTVSGTYLVDATTGRVAITATGTPPILYLVSANQALIVGTDASASGGILEAQTGSGFTNGSFKGNYLGGNLPLPLDAATNTVALLSADGNGSVTITSDSSGPGGLATNQSGTGTYAVDGTGRVLLTAEGSTEGIFYVVSPTKVVFLTANANGFVGNFEQ